MKIREFPLAAAAAFFMALSAVQLSGCQPAASQTGHNMPPPEVSIVTVEPQTVPVNFEYTGETAGSREVEVRARVTGVILKRNYREGERVVQGQSMFTVDPAPFSVAVARAEAALASAEAKLFQAKLDRERFEPLLAQKAISRKNYDDAVAAERVAAADVQLARANLAEARLNLGYTRVEAPVNGIASRALRSEGNYVSGPDVLLTTVSQIDPIYALFGISDEERLKLVREAEAGRLKLPPDNQFEVTVKLADDSVYAKTGKVNFSGVRVSSDTGTSEIRAELPNPDGLLRPGQFVRVTLKGAERPDAILVPQRAVLEGSEGKFVYVVNAENKAEARPVELSSWQGNSWIVAGGLKAGDKVIVDGVIKIGPGVPVTVASSGTETADHAPPQSQNTVEPHNAGDRPTRTVAAAHK